MDKQKIKITRKFYCSRPESHDEEYVKKCLGFYAKANYDCAFTIRINAGMVGPEGFC
jgi:hypothetical protein